MSLDELTNEQKDWLIKLYAANLTEQYVITKGVRDGALRGETFEGIADQFLEQRIVMAKYYSDRYPYVPNKLEVVARYLPDWNPPEEVLCRFPKGELERIREKFNSAEAIQKRLYRELHEG